MKVCTLAILLIVPALAYAQAPPPKDPNAEDLLKQVAAAYAHAGNYHVEVVEDEVQKNELEHRWTKTYRTVIHGRGNRYRIEVRYADFHWIQVSDGATEWNYWDEAKRYTRHPLGDKTPSQAPLSNINYEIGRTRDTITLLGQLAANSIHAKRLTDKTISLNGHRFACYVVRAELTKGTRAAFSSDSTFWIDKQTHVFRKIVSHEVNSTAWGDVYVPLHWDLIRTYPVVDLDTAPPDSTFLFTPPEGVKLVERMTADPNAPFQPHAAPDIQLTDATGKKTPLSSYRGHPVLIDIWATWCGPCIGTMPAFAKLADTYRGSGLTILTIDEDIEAQTALDYLKRNNFVWKDYHDKDEEQLYTLNGTGIPFVVLIDKDGTIVFENNTGFYEDPLHAALQKMFPSVGSSANSSQK